MNVRIRFAKDRPRVGRFVALAGLSLLAGACYGSGEDGDALAGSTRAASDMNADAPLVGPAAAARADLAERLGVGESAIEVLSVREVTWRDGSVGCPQPGMQYAQVLVNGMQIVLRHAGVDYHYHAGRGREPFYCAKPQDPLPEGAGGLDDS